MQHSSRFAIVPPRPPQPAPWRCPRCGGLLAKVYLSPGSILQIKCGRCNALVTKEAA